MRERVAVSCQEFIFVLLFLKIDRYYISYNLSLNNNKNNKNNNDFFDSQTTTDTIKQRQRI